ncbi:sigma-70 family RNA polymerase sigma factor [Streptomyces sp. CHD11]|uniref:sigma-70 family RNA polymerase sigma factor n=1 Tax=Streptomyces sp. CHD11 TaxID=2741325 RepID=UPI001BFC88F2|nr:sigma-70 family RNA polymerase sigma factor [Streptomyces sp. CHD11]MBT3150434.1 sigma-70 family RNA polymerase sigma factor [Streptomyces sp. CHD11]
MYERYGVMLRKFAASMLNGNWDGAEDILQETAIRAWLQAKKRPDADVRLYSWLKTVAHNLVIDEHRARRVRPHTVQITDEDATFQAVDQADLVIDRIELMGALEKLSRPHREILQHVYLRDLSVLEVSRELAIPSGTVKSRTYHAIKALRAALTSSE